MKEKLVLVIGLVVVLCVISMVTKRYVNEGDIVMNILKATNQQGATICLVTHDPDFSAMAGREIFLVDGRIVDRKNEKSIQHATS